MSSFAELGVSKPVVDALSKRGIAEPFAVQNLVIGDVLEGRDVLAQSPTGSGKTLAFGVPLIELLKSGAKHPAGLILAPTRELAVQIVEQLEPIAKVRGLKVAPVYGGVGIEQQARRAARADIIVACPGRLEDLMQRGAVSIGSIRVLVVDEADRMLDMGFKPALDRIVAATPRDRQTLFFSATLEGVAGKQARAYTRDARRHVHTPPAETKGEIEHRFIHLDHDSKLAALVDELRDTDHGRTLVFVRTKHGADRLVKRLARKDVRSVAMHGNKSQSQRQKALARFERGEVRTLVATDVAARGIDVAEITHVIHYDAPGDRDTYVHRTGRTGRAGADGVGVSFVLPDQRSDMSKIARDLGLRTEFDGGRQHQAAPIRERGAEAPARNSYQKDPRQHAKAGGRGDGKPGAPGTGKRRRRRNRGAQR